MSYSSFGNGESKALFIHIWGNTVAYLTVFGCNLYYFLFDFIYKWDYPSKSDGDRVFEFSLLFIYD